jgi:hypothetical protein
MLVTCDVLHDICGPDVLFLVTALSPIAVAVRSKT